MPGVLRLEIVHLDGLERGRGGWCVRDCWVTPAHLEVLIPFAKTWISL